jgi:signal transduction histidine kinase
VSEVADARPVAPQRWVFVMTVAFLYTASVLRSLLTFEGGQLALVLVLLAAWLILLLSEPVLSRLWEQYFIPCAAMQALTVAVLLTQSNSSDFFALLLAVTSMQAIQRWGPRSAAILMALFAALMVLALNDENSLTQAVTYSALYTIANVFLATYALAAKRATEARLHNETLVGELQEANRRTADYARRAERLAGARERQRLARELHDSVTQTLFSMTLTAQSARLLLGRQPQQVTAQLDQVEHLAHSALTEMDALSAALPPQAVSEEGLVARVQRHISERTHQDGLSVSLEVEGDERPAAGDEAALLRIVQEALNNVVKHAEASHAVVRLCLRHPFTLVIEDQGRGFDRRRVSGRGVGLTSMTERADEIGWRLTVTSAPGAGTRVVAEEALSEGGPSHAGD